MRKAILLVSIILFLSQISSADFFKKLRQNVNRVKQDAKSKINQFQESSAKHIDNFKSQAKKYGSIASEKIQESYDKYGPEIGNRIRESYDKYGKIAGEKISEAYNEYGPAIGRKIQESYDKYGPEIGNRIRESYDKYGKIAGEKISEAYNKYGPAIGRKIQESYDKYGPEIGNRIRESYDKYGKIAGEKISEAYNEYGPAIGRKIQESYDKYGPEIGNRIRESYDKYGKIAGEKISEAYNEYGPAIGRKIQESYDKYGPEIGEYIITEIKKAPNRIDNSDAIAFVGGWGFALGEAFYEAGKDNVKNFRKHYEGVEYISNIEIRTKGKLKNFKAYSQDTISCPGSKVYKTLRKFSTATDYELRNKVKIFKDDNDKKISIDEKINKSSMFKANDLIKSLETLATFHKIQAQINSGEPIGDTIENLKILIN